MKNHKITLSLIFIIIVTITITGFRSLPGDTDYEQEWMEVDAMAKKGKPKSAIIIIDKIYSLAKSEKNTPQIIKSLIYKISMESTFAEDYQLKSITTLEKELNTALPVEKQILQSLIAQLYQSYYNNNKWIINDRLQTNTCDENDISTWGTKTFIEKIGNLYMLSLEDKEQTRAIQINDFHSIIENNKDASLILWPTLYDLLANRALEYFSTPDAGIIQMSTLINKNTDYFLPAKDFTNLNIDNKSPQEQTLNIYQDLLRTHLHSKNIEALVDLDIRRLNYIYRNSKKYNNLDNNYIQSLNNLGQKYNNQTVYPLIAFQIAKYYFDHAGLYTPKAKNSDYLVKADKICRKAISLFPDVAETDKCRNLISEINKTSFSFEIPTTSIPNNPTLSLVEFRNIDKLYFKIIKSDPLAYAKKNDIKQYMKKLMKNNPITNWVQQLPETSDHHSHSVEMTIPALKPGFYIVIASNDENFSSSEDIVFKGLWISNLSYILSYNKEKGINEIYALNRETGNPISDVQITVYQRKYNNRNRDYSITKVKTLNTDKTGYAIMEADKNTNYGTYLLMFEKNDNTLLSENYLNFYKYSPDKKWQKKTYIFTDRAIYRPGQIVNYSILFIERNNNDVRLIKNESAEISFINTSRKEISKNKSITDEDGSVRGTFVIPRDLLNGRMTIKTKYGSANISVEDYKLPTFEVNFDSLAGQPKLGQSIKVTGNIKGYAGNIINNATIKYTVTKRTSFPIPYYRGWHPYFNQPDIEIASGKITSSATGTFVISFIAEAADNIPEKSNPVYNYIIHADVTDISGEVQSADTEIQVGYKPLILKIDIADVISLNGSNKGNIIATNLNRTPITINIKTELFKLDQPNRLLNPRQWETPDFYTIPKEEFIKQFPHAPYKDEDNLDSRNKSLISSNSFTLYGKAPIPESLFTNIDPGQYFISVVGMDAEGNTIETGKYITIYSPNSKNLPSNLINFKALSKTKAEPGESIFLTIGSATKKAKILYEIVNGVEIVERNWVKINNSQKTIEIPIKESYRGNFTVNTTMIKFNRLYSASNKITVPFTNKKLDIKLNTYRNFLTPGSKEEWSVVITDYQNNKVATNLLAGMYDAALDIYKENNWGLNLYYDKSSYSRWESNQFTAIHSSYLFDKDIDYIKTQIVKYPTINWFGYPLYGNTLYKISSSNMRGGRAETLTMNIDGVQIDQEDEEAEPTNNTTSETYTPKKENTVVPLRKNFNETAFFYPQLHTNNNGEVKFSFTSPDALTEWKIQLLAYTNDLSTGSFETTIKSKKDLMVIPNLPRFIRTGDTIEFTAKVTNFTEEDIITKTDIEFFNPVTDEKLDLLVNSTKVKNSNIKALQSISLSWRIAAPETAGLLAYRIKSQTDKFSDGEEKMFPVLTNRILVTTTMPIHIGGKSSKHFSFNEVLESNSSTLKNINYTVEFTSNPAWYAIQAIPYLEENNSRSNLALFNRYYANAISSFIVNSNPKIKAVFESWKTITPDALISNLEKNQELKNILLEATPWILEAENDSEQKRRIGLLLDINRMANEKETILNKLQKEQLNSGAWPWFAGMPADRYTTQSIILNLAKLHSKGIIDLNGNKRRLSMAKKAVAYLDNEIEKRYLKLKNKGEKTLSANNLSSYDIQYLYLRSELSKIIPIPTNAENAIDYFIDQSKKHWLKESNYLQGMIAQYLYTTGHRNESEAIVRSLQERSLFNKEMGMYWRSNKSFSWYDAPVETQAMMIETFAKLHHSPTLIEQMKIWLLKQKQVQQWGTSSATAEAVFALLMYGNNDLNSSDIIDVTVGSENISSNTSDNSIEAGTGFFTHSWKGKKISNDLAQIKVENPNNNIAWGAAYWQYTENIEKVKSQKTSLSIDKHLFIEKNINGIKELIELDENSAINVGDKIVVRLIISSDRNMEYIHLRDMRATCMEPVKELSGYSYSGGLWFYKNITDTGNDFFIQRLNKGTYIVDYQLYVTQSGSFTNGIATIQSIYAPEFASHSKGIRINVSR